MSGVDQRIVEMRFDNAQFEKGVNQSVESLEKLTEALDLKDAGKGFDGLAKAAKGVSFSDVSDSVEELTNKFSTMGIVGMAALQKLTHMAIDMAKQIANKTKNLIMVPAKTGYEEYETKMGIIKTIMAGSSAPIEEVSRELDKLNKYADDTIYSFSEMTRNVAKFTNTGMKVAPAVQAIIGASNLGALAGTTPEKLEGAMLGISKGMQMGKFQAREWRSFISADMATQEFTQLLIDKALALGTINKKTGKSAKGGKKSEVIDTKNMLATLGDGWLTSAVMEAALLDLGDKNTPIGKKAYNAATQVTKFTELIKVFKEALGTGWANTWELVFGNFNQVRAWLSGIKEYFELIIERNSEARNAIVKEWRTFGGFQYLNVALWTLIDTFFRLKDVVVDAWQNIFGVVSGIKLAQWSKNIQEATLAFRLWLEGAADGSKLTRLEQIGKIFEGLFSILDLGKTVIGIVFKGILGAINLLTGGTLADDLLGFFSDLGIKITDLVKWLKSTEVTEWFAEFSLKIAEWYLSLKAFLKPGLDFMVSFGEEIRQAFGRIFGLNLLDETDNASNPKKFWTEFKKKYFGEGGTFEGFFENIWTNLKAEWENAKKKFKKTFTDIKESLVTWFNDLEFGKDLKLWWTKVKKIWQPITDWIKGAIKTIKTFFADIFGLAADPTTGREGGGGGKPTTPWWEKLKTFFTVEGFTSFLDEMYIALKAGWDKTKAQIAETFENIKTQVIAWVMGLSITPHAIAWWEKISPKLAPIIQSLVELGDTLKNLFARLFGLNILDETDNASNPKKFWEQFKAKYFVEGGFKLFFDELWKNLKIEWAVAKLWISETFTNIKQSFSDWFNGLTIAPVIKEWWSKLKTKMQPVLDWFAPFVAKIKKFFLDILGLTEGKTAIAKGFMGFWAGTGTPSGGKGEKVGLWTQFAEKFSSLDSALEYLSEIWANVKSKWLLFSDGVGTIWTQISDRLKEWWEAIQPILSTLYHLAVALTPFVALIVLAVKIRKAAASIESIFTSMTGLTDGINEIFKTTGSNAAANRSALALAKEKAKEKRDWGKTLLDIAKAVALIGVVVAAFAYMDQDKLKDGMIKVGIILGSMFALLVVGSLVKGDISKTGTGMFKMAEAVGLIIAAVVAVMALLNATTDKKSLITAGIIVLGIFALLTYFSKKMPSGGASGGSWQSVLAVAVSVMIIVNALKPLADMSTDQLKRMGVALLALTVAMAIIVKSTNSMPTSRSANKSGWKSILAIVIGMWAIVKILKPLANMKDDEISRMGVALFGITAALRILMGGMKGLDAKGSLLVLLGLAATMWALSYSLNQLKSVNDSKITAFTDGLAKMMLGLAVVFKVTKGMTLWQIGKGLIGLLGLFSVITLVIAAFGLVSKNPKLQAWMNSGAASLGEIIGAFIGNMKASEMKHFAAGLKGFTDITVDEASVDHAIAVSSKISKFADGLPGGGLWDRLMDWMFGSKLENFSGDMVVFGESFHAFATAMNLVFMPEGFDEKVDQAIAIGEAIQQFEQKLTPVTLIEAMTGWFGGDSKGSLGLFSTDIVLFAEGMKIFAAEVSKIEFTEGLDTGVADAIRIAEQMRVFDTGLGEQDALTKILQAISNKTKTKMESFADDLPAFAEGFNSFVAGMAKFKIPLGLSLKTTAALHIADKIKVFGEGIKDNSGWVTLTSALTGYSQTSLSLFMKDMEHFAQMFNHYVLHMALIPTDLDELEDKTDAAVRIAESINKLNKDIPTITVTEALLSWALKDTGKNGTKLGQFADAMGIFGINMQLLNEKMNDTYGLEELEGKITTALVAVEALKTFVVGMEALQIDDRGMFAIIFNSDTSTLTKFMQFVADFGTKIRNLSIDLEFIDLDSYTEKFGKAFASIKDLLGLIVSSDTGVEMESGLLGKLTPEIIFNFAGVLTHLETLGQKIKSFISNTEGIETERFQALLNPIKDFLEGLGDFGSLENTQTMGVMDVGALIAKALTDGIEIGLREDEEKVQKAITALMDILKTQAITDISPPGVFGTPIIDSFVSGINDYTESAANPVTAIGELLTAMKTAVTTAITTPGMFGEPIVDSLTTGINDYTESATNPVTAMTSLIGAVKTAAIALADGFMSVGFYIDQGIANGIRKYDYLPISAARAMAGATLQAAKNRLKSASPSIAFEDLGFDSVLGLANGFTKNEKLAINASRGLGTAVLESLGIFEGVDNSPVIRPVVDLTNVRTSAEEANNMFVRRTSLGVRGINTSNMNERTSSISDPNGASVTQDALNYVGSKINELGEKLGRLQVVMDTGAMVGQLSPGVDKTLGRAATYKGRGFNV